MNMIYMVLLKIRQENALFPTVDQMKFFAKRIDVKKKFVGCQ
jgi:hypothetical protein